MTFLQELLVNIFQNYETSLLALAFVIAVGSQCAGLLVSRQWFLLPLALGIAGLSGFLLNPLADSNTVLDLQLRFTGADTLLALCAGQFLLSAACLLAVLRSVSGVNRLRWQTVLGLLSCLPSPALLVPLLLVEQQWLASEQGARPELAGIGAGVAVALLLLSGCICGRFLKQQIVLRLHISGCLGLCLLAGLLTTLNQSLPDIVPGQTLGQMLQETGVALSIAVVCAGIGFFLGRRDQVQTRPAESKP